MKFDEWFKRSGFDEARRTKLRCKWSYLLRKGLSANEIAAVFDGFV